jgi:hypothetical protein
MANSLALDEMFARMARARKLPTFEEQVEESHIFLNQFVRYGPRNQAKPWTACLDTRSESPEASRAHSHKRARSKPQGAPPAIPINVTADSVVAFAAVLWDQVRARM